MPEEDLKEAAFDCIWPGRFAKFRLRSEGEEDDMFVSDLLKVEHQRLG